MTHLLTLIAYSDLNHSGFLMKPESIIELAMSMKVSFTGVYTIPRISVDGEMSILLLVSPVSGPSVSEILKPCGANSS